jgi:Fe-S-cluster containining protein
MLIDEFLDMLEEDLRLYDEMIEHRRVATERATGRVTACQACPHAAPGCCYQKNLVYLREVLPIARYLKLNQLDTPEFRQRLLEEGERMEAAGRDTWFREAHPCIFLEKGRCSVYALRPGSCRAYHVVSDPANCQPDSYLGIEFIDYGPLHPAWIQQTYKAHAALRLKDSEQRVFLGTLPRMVHIALEALEAHDFRGYIKQQKWPGINTLEAWVEGENPFRDRLINIRRRATP